MGIWYDQDLEKNSLRNSSVGMLLCWGEVAQMHPSLLRPNPYIILGVARAHIGQLLLKLSITDFYTY